ncbi:argininosuccinate synthase (plasmid) [Streptomyces sp. BB1-1-1]|uniref:argininosuccinate synthase domain-containing protein n=1 Tax=Streptomyces sp. BB1-1-1 TaxID=3074430 RepID=UPI0028774EB7|nr:argininosuccinate synthase domain-containing protein [Streptomyces sp. BB1-1-1]WND32864.1 argininosuccinate synthase [Streptomyces sp. BB1-1-1]WND40067.1 argininosuccinate synthase [Streptomyces sp. BB1-1-1]WND40902.1 argininosuccinate synthase [Streptomyces sp. BB1-1-1]
MLLTTSLEDLSEKVPDRPLVLYSGGVDGTYLLKWLVDRSANPLALVIDLGTNADPAATARADALGVEVERVDATEEFFREFLPAAIHADAYYEGLYPIGSSISRPLMGRLAAQVARQRDCDTICHSATAMQNSGVRLSAAIAHFSPELPLAAPFLQSAVSRERMVSELTSIGIEFPHGVHSIDTNPWARVIECGSLDSPENELDSDVFQWSATPDTAFKAGPEVIELAFDRGLPVSLNGKGMPLASLVPQLNEMAGARGVGRFSGLEDTFMRGKNHEVREAPAASVITTAHRALANAVFEGKEYAVRNFLATAWTHSVVEGGWYNHTTQCVRDALEQLDRIVTGVVRLRIFAGSVGVERLESPHGLYRHRLTGPGWPSDHTGAHGSLIATLAHIEELRRDDTDDGPDHGRTAEDVHPSERKPKYDGR